MRRGGRATTLAGLFPYQLCLCAHLAVVSSSDYGIPIEIKLWDTGRTPLAHMVDVTNGFGLKVLAEHNFLNENNIAFSPYGLMGILVALFEGVDGESSYQIQRGMQLPWNRNVMRIGFRDIHRTLKTYFVPEEGFLAGLALNNENVTFNDSYKKLLRFYGFDLEGDQLPTFFPANSTNETTSASPMASDTTTAARSPEAATTEAPATDSPPTREEASTPPTKEQTTTNPNAETINDIDIRGQNPDSTTASAPASNAESTTATSTAEQTASQATTTVATTTMTTTSPTVAEVSTTTTSNAESTVQSTISSTVARDIESTVQSTVSSTMTTIDEPTSNNEIDAMTTREISMAESTTTETPTTALTTTALTTTLSSIEVTQTESMMTTVSTETTTEQTSTTETISADTSTVTESTIETLERRKRSIVDFIFTNPPYIDDYLVYKSYDLEAELPPMNFDDHKMFLVNGLRNVQVTYMHYDTILEHAYLPHLEASALRLPLDSDRYYLLVVLPLRGGVAELGRLLSRMARESDLSDVYEALRPRRVRAIVPSFTVKGHVTLTTDLQKLGIRDVFEPRQRDFTPMTHQPGVYVRSIEQAVSVAIRKYRPDDQKKNRYVHNRQPVRFSATYPFLYFVMDSSIHVALMAGKMVDPLNNRIL